jgi:hypothetical protein
MWMVMVMMHDFQSQENDDDDDGGLREGREISSHLRLLCLYPTNPKPKN